MKQLDGPLVVMACIGLSILVSEASAGNVKRSCNAYYHASVDSISFDNGKGKRKVGFPFRVVNVSNQQTRFTAERGCGKLVPNRCRKRARNDLLACAKAHASSPSRLPQECRSVKNYVGPNLMDTIKTMACGRLATKDGIRITDFVTRPYDLELTLGISVHGGDDCGERKPTRTMVDGKKYPVEGNKLFVNTPIKRFKITCK